MAVSVGAPADKYGCNDKRARYAHHANHVSQHTVPSPFLESFLLGFGESVIAHAGPVLLRAIVAISKIVGGHYVGAAFAAV